MELIDRRKLVSDFWQGVEDGDICSFDDTDNLMENAPTVDAVEVVRCKDCKWYNPRGGVAGQKTIICSYQSGDFFCSYGERREDGGC